MNVGDVPRRRAPRRPGARPVRMARVVVGRRSHPVPVWTFESLGAGESIRGPAIVLQSGATLWVAPGWRGRLHSSGALVLERGRR